jgi:subtilisin-like proprotein convertase family protein
MVRPHLLPASVAVTYAGYGDQDALQPAADATVIMGTAIYPGSAGVLAYDDNPAPQAGQIVVWAFNIAAIDPAVGRLFVENAASYLLADEPAATGSLGGTVTVAGGGDPSGATVSLGGGLSQVTGPDGRYLFSELYGGLYTVTVSKDGFASMSSQVTLEDGEALDGVDFTLLPVYEVNYSVAPGLPIPDNNSSGVVSTLVVDAAGPLASVTVDIDIDHTYIGDLSVTLFSPAGVSLVLHNRSGGSADDIVGNWPETLTVDGPGALADLVGTEASGTWALHVVDHAGSDLGTLQSWGLNLEIPDQVTAADVPPAVTRLVGNRPNPFNPRTTLAFETARTGAVQLLLYDLRGRLVRRLVDGELPAGRHEVLWDGRDGQGREQASGVYLARFVADQVVQEHKLVLVR